MEECWQLVWEDSWQEELWKAGEDEGEDEVLCWPCCFFSLAPPLLLLIYQLMLPLGSAMFSFWVIWRPFCCVLFHVRRCAGLFVRVEDDWSFVFNYVQG